MTDRRLAAYTDAAVFPYDKKTSVAYIVYDGDDCKVRHVRTTRYLKDSVQAEALAIAMLLTHIVHGNKEVAQLVKEVGMVIHTDSEDLYYRILDRVTDSRQPLTNQLIERILKHMEELGRVSVRWMPRELMYEVHALARGELPE